MNQAKQHNVPDNQGLSLMVVIVVGSIMLFSAVTLGTHALRSLQSAQVSSDGTRALYGAEEAFECVKYHVDRSPTVFWDPEPIICNGAAISPQPTPQTTAESGYDRETVFDLPIDNQQTVRVAVYRTSEAFFNGMVRVYSNSEDETSKKNNQRYQEYEYTRLLGADIVFVVDRSGSIQGTRTHDPVTATGDWQALVQALVDSVYTLMNKIPRPKVGIVTFGSHPDPTGDGWETGAQVAISECTNNGGADCANANWREPDITLTDVETDVLVGGALNSGLNIGVGHTNLSLGLSIAGAELMKRYYPHGADADPVWAFRSGGFEHITFDGAAGEDYADLPTQSSPRDRDDDIYPDLIIVVTDGEPNVLMSHIAGNHESGQYLSDLTWTTLGLLPYAVGEKKIFQTRAYPGAGQMVVADVYAVCDDSGSTDPIGYFGLGSPLAVNDYPYIAMCNAALIADNLKNGVDFPANEDPIMIAAIGVNVGAGSYTETFLRDELVSDVDGEKLYASVDDFEGVTDAVFLILGKLNLVKSL